MSVKQLSVFVENKQGSLVKALRAVSEAGLNIRAMSIADTQDFGVIRLIVGDTEKAVAVLSDSCLVRATDVVAAKMDDKAGALCGILSVLDDAAINVEYMYAFTAPTATGAYVVLRVSDVAEAEKALTSGGIEVLDKEAIKGL
ncbi:MAG: ACT domain-containing protein [Clostridia bacterium]|nr:ACT domain-containing protein [Clostridia bacterium]